MLSQRYPFIVVRSLVPFPETEISLAVGRKASLDAISSALMSKEKLLLLVSQKESEKNKPELLSDMYKVGTICVIEQSVIFDDAMKILCRGLGSVHISSIKTEDGIQLAETSPYVTEDDKSVATNEECFETAHLMAKWRDRFFSDESQADPVSIYNGKQHLSVKSLVTEALNYVWSFPVIQLSTLSADDRFKIGITRTYQTAFDQNKNIINQRIEKRQAILEALTYPLKLSLIRNLMSEEIEISNLATAAPSSM